MTVRWPALWEGMQALMLTSGQLSAVVLPEAGAKVASLVVRGRDVLWRNPHVPIRPASYGARYRNFGASGIDICFPSIAACPFPVAPWLGTTVPDHGEVWAMPWLVDLRPDGVHLAVDGRQWPYTLGMTLQLDDGALHIHTKLENAGDAPFPYQWAVHPVFPLTGQTRLDWPGCEPPGANRQLNGLSRPGLTPEGFVSKTFVGPLPAGEASIELEHARVQIRWDAQMLPYLGVWISNEDEGRPGGRRCLAVEPSAAPTDSLEEAAKSGQAPVLVPGEPREWQVSIGLAVGLTPGTA